MSFPQGPLSDLEELLLVATGSSQVVLSEQRLGQNVTKLNEAEAGNGDVVG